MREKQSRAQLASSSQPQITPQVPTEQNPRELISSELASTRRATGDGIEASNARWSFAGNVPQNFDRHIEKSIPFYREAHQLILKLSDFFLGNNSLCYDLGCSTGTLSSAIAARHQDIGTRVIGIDSVPEMTEYAGGQFSNQSNLKIVNSELTVFEFEKSDLVVACFTLQFIHPKFRQDLLNRIYQSLNWSGALLMFEKVRAPDARFQDMMTQVYQEHKFEQGYSPEQIYGKSNSLKGVLEPFSTQGNLDLLTRAGFVDVMSVMKYVCFEGFLAIK